MTLIHFITNHWLALSIAALVVVACVAQPMLALALVRKYWQYILAVGLLFVAYEMGFRTANVANQFANAQERNAQAAAQQAESDRLQKQADAANERLRKVLAAIPK